MRWCIALWCTCVSFGVAASPPNIVFVLVDDLRFDGMGFLNPTLQTPHIDALAAGGMYLPNAVVTTSLCSPSRATILTGQSTRNHGIVDNNSSSEAGLRFFPQYLQQAGYQTAFIGKWHMGRDDDNPRTGFDHWVSFKGQGFYNPTDRIPSDEVARGVRHQLNVDGKLVDQQGYITDELTDYALDWLSHLGDDRPFFLYLSHKAVHSNATPAPRHQEQYTEVDIPVPDPEADQGAAGAGKPMWVQNQRNSWHGVDFMYHSSQAIADYSARYYATLSSVDDGIGRLVAALRARGQLDNSLIVFYSDNGFLFGDHGLIDKRNAYEPSVRVPMVVFAPGLVAAGQTVNARVRNLDLAPTFLDFAGIAQPEQFEGRSLKPLLTGAISDSDWHSDAFVYEYYWEWSFPHTPTTFAITEDEIKYIQYHGLWDLEELYDLRRDPIERINLINNINYRNRLIARRHSLYQALTNSAGEHVVPFSEKKAQGIRFRSRDGSSAADFPESFVRDPNAKDLFNGFFAPAAIEPESKQ